MSVRYIWIGSLTISPSLNAAVGAVGVSSANDAGAGSNVSGKGSDIDALIQRTIAAATPVEAAEPQS